MVIFNILTYSIVAVAFFLLYRRVRWFFRNLHNPCAFCPGAGCQLKSKATDLYVKQDI